MKNKRFSKYSILIALILFVFLGFSGTLDQAFTALGRGKVEAMNCDYLKVSSERSSTMLILLTELKEILAFLESSNTGVSIFGADLEIGIGRVLQPASDAIDHAWKAVIASLSSLFIIDVLQQGASHVGHWILSIWSLALLIYYVVKTWMAPAQQLVSLFGKIVEIITCAALFLYLLLPVSIAGSAFLARKLTDKTHTEVHAQLNDIHSKVYTSYSSLHDHSTSISGHQSPTLVKTPKKPENIKSVTSANHMSSKTTPPKPAPAATTEKKGFIDHLFHRNHQHTSNEKSTLAESDPGLSEKTNALGHSTLESKIKREEQTIKLDVERPLHNIEYLTTTFTKKIETPIHDIATDIRKIASHATDDLKKTAETFEKMATDMGEMHHLWLETHTLVHDKKHEIISLVHQLLAVYALEVFIFPLGLLYLSFRGAKKFSSQIFHYEMKGS